MKNSLTLHIVEFTPLLLQLLLQGVTLPLQARQSFPPLELLTGHLDPGGGEGRGGRHGGQSAESKDEENVVRWSRLGLSLPAA